MGNTVIDKVPRAAIEVVRYAILQSGSMGAARAALTNLSPLPKPKPLDEHLQETVQWIFRAHDACERGGVSRSYSLRRHRRYGCTGWLPAYPETTGYIIPTLYEVAELLEWPEAAERAVQMADWEADVQMDDGAVRGGTIADEPSPAVFNTGQVLFGWVTAAEKTSNQRYADCAARAARFLVDAQDPDGSWRRGASKFASSGGHVYNARAAWGLARYAEFAKDDDAMQSACRAADFALAQQLDNGWFGENCLTDHDRPLVHTIAYAAQGVLEIGLISGVEKYVDAARKTAKAMASKQHADGFLAGRFDRHWEPTVGWSCLTGCAQMALVWMRLAELDGTEEYKKCARRAVEYVTSTQKLHAAETGIRGGVAGSYPIWGEYGMYEYLNWAAKFLVDAMLSLKVDRPCGIKG